MQRIDRNIVRECNRRAADDLGAAYGFSIIKRFLDPRYLMYTIDHTHDLNKLLADTRVWNDLAMGIPFRETSWLSPWWSSFGDKGREFAMIATASDGAPHGILPLYRRETGRFGRTLAVIGDGIACSDFVSGLANSQDAEVIGRQMGRRLAELAGDSDDGWDLIDIDGVSEGDGFMIALAKGLREGGATLHFQSRMHTWFRAAEESWETHLKKHGKTQRRTIRARAQRVESTAGLEHRVASTHDQVQQWLDALIELYQKRWTQSGCRGSFAESRFDGFIREAAADFFARGRLYLPTLQLDGRVIAAELHFLGGNGRLYCYSSGFDTSLAKLEPGRVLHINTLMHVYAEKLIGIDFLRGDEPYKKRTGATATRVFRFRAVAPTWLPRLKHAAWYSGFELKQWMRRQSGRQPIEVVDLEGMASSLDDAC